MIITKVSKRFKEQDPAELISLPQILTVNSFTEASAKEFRNNMSLAIASGQPIIPVIIDSYGGQVYSLFSMTAAIKTSPVPVATIVTGKAMSCGAILFSCGTEGHRYVSPDSTIMIHDVSSGSFGKVSEIKADSKETQRLNKKIFSMMATNCGKDPDYFDKKVHALGRADWYLTPEEAVKHNLANHIRIPKLMVKASVSMKLV